MKSWHLIAVVGDALQVRRGKAESAVREGETRERKSGEQAAGCCSAS